MIDTNEISCKENPLGKLDVGKLLAKFAIPSIIAMLVGALYNIVDQYFIGNSVGELGNAATNIAFPLTISCTSIALLFGIGGASAFNLTMGEGNQKKAAYYIGNAVTMLVACGVLLLVVTQLFLGKMLVFFGSSDNVLPYAKVYTRITSLGFPALILSTGGAHLVRADGSPRYSMFCNIVGAVINTILDALFVFKFNLGMAGAAWATIIGQYISATLVIVYILRFKSVKLAWCHFRPKYIYFGRCASLGTASFFNQVAMMVVQIVLNNSFKYYGGLSVYGQDIPIACAGIVTKVGQLFFSIIIGICQGLQPIVSFNYGAEKYGRVKKSVFLAIKICTILSVAIFFVFQLLPLQIIQIFGKDESEEYYRFAVRYFRIYFFFVFINFMQPVISNFFSATGRPQKGMFLSLTRQIIFLIPLILILPIFFGIDGMIYAGPIADAMAAIICTTLVIVEFRNKRYREKETV